MRNEIDDIRYALDTFAGRQRCFTLGDLLDWLGERSAWDNAKSRLIRDDRFCHFRDSTIGKRLSLSKGTLFDWWLRYSVRLFRAKVTRLSGRQLALGMSSLRVNGKWDSPPEEYINFGKQYGFVDLSVTSDMFAFPFANLLTKFSESDRDIAMGQMRNIFTVEPAEGPVGLVLEGLIHDGLSKFNERTQEVVEARDLKVENRPTLQELGDKIGVTRERVRQLQSRFWKELVGKRRPELIRPFMLAFIIDFIHRKGSLLVNFENPEDVTRPFLAKCLAIDLPRLPDSKLGLMSGGLRKIPALQLPANEASDLIAQFLNENSIAEDLDHELNRSFALGDILKLAKEISRLRRQALSKTQRVCLTLRDIGQPSHFTAITAAYNVNYPMDQSTVRNIHALLINAECGIVWIGVKGMYALEEWGYQRPAQGLYDTIASIVKLRYEETAEPVSESYIKEELGKHRQILISSSFTFATQLNPELRPVLGRAYVPESFSGKVANGGLATNLTNNSEQSEVDRMVSRLLMSSIAGPEFVGQHRAAVVEQGKNYTIAELKAMVYRGIGESDLSDMFRTEQRLSQADSAIKRFVSVAEMWKSGKRRDNKVTWILGNNFSKEELSAYAVDHSKMMAKLGNLGDDHSWLFANSSDVNVWLPFLSMELVLEIKRLKPGDLSVLQKVLLKATRDIFKESPHINPSSPDFPCDVQSYSIFWLFQFEPTSQCLRILIRLNNIHCRNVGHIAALRPSALDAIRKFDATAWRNLAIGLGRLGDDFGTL